MRAIPQAAIDLVKEAEGLRLAAYPDPATKAAPWTIGYGHTGSDVHPGLTITRERAEQLLQEDLQEAADIVTKAVTVPLTPAQLGALALFVMNVGPGRKGVKDGFVSLKSGKPSTMLTKLNGGDYDGAAAEFSKWTKAAGKVMPGLVKRRAAEAALFLSDANHPVSRAVEQPAVMKPLSQSTTVQAGAGGLTLAGVTVGLQQAKEVSGAARELLDTLPAVNLSAGWIVSGILAAAIALMLYRRWDDRRKAVA